MTDNSQLGMEQIIKDLNKKIDIVYRHSTLVSDYSVMQRDYGVGHLINEVEIHNLGYICDQEGITVTQLAADTYRTKGAVSQLVKKLEAKGLVKKVQKDNDKKSIFLYPTEEGKRVSSIHRGYDRIKTMEMIDKLHQTCTLEEIESFYKIMELRIKVFEEELKNSIK